MDECMTLFVVFMVFSFIIDRFYLSIKGQALEGRAEPRVRKISIYIYLSKQTNAVKENKLEQPQDRMCICLAVIHIRLQIALKTTC